jgi:hypothetical protein
MRGRQMAFGRFDPIRTQNRVIFHGQEVDMLGMYETKNEKIEFLEKTIEVLEKRIKSFEESGIRVMLSTGSLLFVSGHLRAEMEKDWLIVDRLTNRSFPFGSSSTGSPSTGNDWVEAGRFRMKLVTAWEIIP